MDSMINRWMDAQMNGWMNGLMNVCEKTVLIDG